MADYARSTAVARSIQPYNITVYACLKTVQILHITASLGFDSNALTTMEDFVGHLWLHRLKTN